MIDLGEIILTMPLMCGQIYSKARDFRTNFYCSIK